MTGHYVRKENENGGSRWQHEHITCGETVEMRQFKGYERGL